jgi:hypothetical protein
VETLMAGFVAGVRTAGVNIRGEFGPWRKFASAGGITEGAAPPGGTLRGIGADNDSSGGAVAYSVGHERHAVG